MAMVQVKLTVSHRERGGGFRNGCSFAQELQGMFLQASGTLQAFSKRTREIFKPDEVGRSRRDQKLLWGPRRSLHTNLTPGTAVRMLSETVSWGARGWGSEKVH